MVAEKAALVLLQAEHNFICLNRYPYTSGHIMVVPYAHIASLEDWAATGVLLLGLAILSFLAEPIANSISRAQEHQADVFGSEVVHGIVADPQTVNAQSFQRLGQESLEYPYPSPFIVFWTYPHPPIAAREAFAQSYDPWQPGAHPRYFSK